MTLLEPGIEYEFTPLNDIKNIYLGKFFGYESVAGTQFIKTSLKGYPFLLNPAHLISICKRKDSLKLGDDMRVEMTVDQEESDD